MTIKRGIKFGASLIEHITLRTAQGQTPMCLTTVCS